MTTGQAEGRQLSASNETVPRDGFRRVIRAGGQEAAGTSEIRRNKDLIASKRHQGGASRRAAGEGARWYFDNRFQGRSGWRRAPRAGARPRRRTHLQSCYDGKPLGSVSWPGSSEPRHRASVSPRSPGGPESGRSGAEIPCNIDRELWYRGRTHVEILLVDEFARQGESQPLTNTQNLLVAGDSQPFPAFRTAPFQYEPSFLGAHADEKSMRSPTAARIGLKRAFTFHGESWDLKRTVNVSEGIPRVSIERRCVTVCVLPTAFGLGPAKCVFGLSPKFSTPVEKTVENRQELTIYGRKCRESQHELARRQPRDVQFRALLDPVKTHMARRNESLGRNPRAD